MRNTPERHTLRTSTLVGLAVLLLVGCSTTGGSKVAGEDMAGLSATDIATLTLEDEFNLFSERYEQMQAVLLDAQLQISDGPWIWNGGDVLPTSGGGGGYGSPLPGADDSNSYYMRAGRIIQPDGATGDISDLEPMQRYFDTKGWHSYLQEISDDHFLWGTTPDGYQVKYAIRTNGNYSIVVYSSLYWTNNAHDLLVAIGDRVPTGTPDATLPGDYERFPKWTDPILD